MPIFSDVMRFKRWYHAAPSFINLSIDPEKCNKATLFRALEENAAIVSAAIYSKLPRFPAYRPTRWFLLAEDLKANYGAKSLPTLRDSPFTYLSSKKLPRWCAIAAGVGVGVWPSLAETGEKLVRWDREHKPNPENFAVYQQAREKWQAVYQDQRALVDGGLTTSSGKRQACNRRISMQKRMRRIMNTALAIMALNT